MENKFLVLRKLVLSCAVLLLSSACFAQIYYVTEDEKGNQTIFQTFSWEQDDGVLKYEFILEREVKGKFVEIKHEELETSSIDLTLENGNYRYKVLAYNFLGFLETETDWITVNIVKAYQPKVNSVSPGVIYLEDDQDGVFVIEGHELSSTTEFYLSHNFKTEGKTKAEILEYDDHRKNRVKIKFDPKKLDAGKWKIVAVNVGGLKDAKDNPNIRWKKFVDFDISAGYAPMFIVASPDIPKYFDKDMLLVVPTVRMTLYPIKRRFGYFGLELNGSAALMEKSASTFKLGTGIVNANVMLVYKKFFVKKRFAMDIHAGAGVVGFLGMQFQFPHDIKSEQMNSLNICAAGGISAQVFFVKGLYAELGCDYVYTFMSDMQFMYVQPQISVGWEF